MERAQDGRAVGVQEAIYSGWWLAMVDCSFEVVPFPEEYNLSKQVVQVPCRMDAPLTKVACRQERGDETDPIL